MKTRNRMIVMTVRLSPLQSTSIGAVNYRHAGYTGRSTWR